MPSQTSLEHLEAEMWREEIEAVIIEIPDVVDISGNTIYIISEEVRGRVIELIRQIEDGEDFLKTVQIRVSEA